MAQQVTSLVSSIPGTYLVEGASHPLTSLGCTPTHIYIYMCAQNKDVMTIKHNLKIDNP